MTIIYDKQRKNYVLAMINAFNKIQSFFACINSPDVKVCRWITDGRGNSLRRSGYDWIGVHLNCNANQIKPENNRAVSGIRNFSTPPGILYAHLFFFPYDLCIDIIFMSMIYERKFKKPCWNWTERSSLLSKTKRIILVSHHSVKPFILK